MKKIVVVLGLLMLATAGGCNIAHEEPVAPVAGPTQVVRTGTSFGNCIGYCNTEMTIDSTEVTLTKSAGGRSATHPPDSIKTLTISLDEWRAINEAADFTTLATLDTIIGCPDCADGGAEWIELRRGDAVKRVTIEYGTTIPPIKELMDRVRAVRDRLR